MAVKPKEIGSKQLPVFRLEILFAPDSLSEPFSSNSPKPYEVTIEKEVSRRVFLEREP